MKQIFMVFTVSMFFSLMVFGQADPKTYTVFDGKGNASNIDKIVQQIETADVVFLGESHDDSVAHKLQFEIFKMTVENYGKKRNVALSLEMFSRDVQVVVDEYLQGLITEKHFLASSNPWGNYKTDYRPLVELAKEQKLRVVAANAPRRYVNMVARLGRKSLDKLSPEAYKFLSPMPLGNSSERYTKKFNALLGTHGSDNIMDSQTLWDETMAYSIAENAKKLKDPLFIHLNGSFHTANRLGTVEQLLKMKPNTKILVVTMGYEENFTKFDKTKHKDWGDFVILTDSKQPRSNR